MKTKLVILTGMVLTMAAIGNCAHAQYTDPFTAFNKQNNIAPTPLGAFIESQQPKKEPYCYLVPIEDANGYQHMVRICN